MSSLPPVGGTTGRRFVAWPAPIASFSSERTVARARIAETSAASDGVAHGNPLFPLYSVDQQSDRINSFGEPENRALAAPPKQMAA